MSAETRDDIAREMRTYFQAQKRNGNPEHRPWHQVLSDWADRIDAAEKRERAVTDAMLACKGKMAPHPDPDNAPPPYPGNAAAMRAALEKIVRIAEEWDTPGIHAVRATLYRILEAARAALAAPPRNCDRFATTEEAENAFVEFCARACSGKVPNWRCSITCGHINPSDWVTCCIKWLLAPAEGGEE